MGTSEYIMFVDETNKTNKNENFCLAGLIMKRFDYEKIIIPKVNKLKKKYFGDTNIILHYSKMKKPRNEYSFLNDQITRNNFYMDLMKIFRENTMTVLAVYFNKNHMKELYSECTISDYNVAFKFLIEKYNVKTSGREDEEEEREKEKLRKERKRKNGVGRTAPRKTAKSGPKFEEVPRQRPRKKTGTRTK